MASGLLSTVLLLSDQFMCESTVSITLSFICSLFNKCLLSQVQTGIVCSQEKIKCSKALRIAVIHLRNIFGGSMLCQALA